MLDDVGHLLTGDQVLFAGLVVVAQDEEGGPLEEDSLAAEGDVAEGFEGGLDELVIGDEQLHDLRPRLIQCLVPNASGEVFLDLDSFALSHFLDLSHFLLDLFLPLLEGHFIDLVYQYKDIRVLIVLLDATESQLPILKALLQSLPMIFNLEDIDKHFHSPEDGLLLDEEVLLHEGILSSAIPQVEGQRSHELELMLLSLDRIADLLCIFGGEVGEDDGVHRGLARTRVAHQ